MSPDSSAQSGSIEKTLDQLRWEALAARSAADFVARYANECCRHTEAVSECPHCNLNFLADYARRAADAVEALLNGSRGAGTPEPSPIEALKAARQFLDPEVSRGPAINGWVNTVAMVDEALARVEAIRAETD